jgi:hypothetical protein
MRETRLSFERIMGTRSAPSDKAVQSRSQRLPEEISKKGNRPAQVSTETGHRKRVSYQPTPQPAHNWADFSPQFFNAVHSSVHMAIIQ